jgi:hypothetical protein
MTRFAFVLALAATPLLAHHSVQAEYDTNHMLTVQGIVTQMQWMNPHAHFWVETKNDDGSVRTWELELPSPNSLVQSNIRKDFVKPGDRITVELWPARNGSSLAHTLSVTRPDGRVLQFPRSWPAER